MTNINLTLTALYVTITIIAISLVPKPHRWKALLFVCLLFYYLLIGTKLVLVLSLVGITYVFSFRVHSKSYVAYLPVALLLIPLLVIKSTATGNHFHNHLSFRFSEYTDWTALFYFLGISYFTFNSISYLIDIKRKYLEPEPNFFYLLLYLIYFPTLFSGPLHRAKYLFHEFRNIEITNDSLSRGMRLILWGVFKNVVIAQRIFIIILQLKDSEIGGYYYLLIGFLFFIYLYCNFSSFMDFFQGVSLLISINLKSNFNNRVYLSSSRQEFWRGWHITLNEWFRDYFFLPVSKLDRSRNYTDVFLLATFFLIALWHEISSVLITWGILNGIWILIEKKVKPINQGFSIYKQNAGIIYHLVFSSILALVFISPSFGFLYDKIFVLPSQLPNMLSDYLVRIFIVVGCFAIMDYHNARAANLRFDVYLGSKPVWVRWMIYFKLTMIILVFGVSSGVDNYYNQF